MEGRLGAFMAADVVGYSRLIRADEEGTLDRLKVLRNKIIDPKIAEHTDASCRPLATYWFWTSRSGD